MNVDLPNNNPQKTEILNKSFSFSDSYPFARKYCLIILKKRLLKYLLIFLTIVMLIASILLISIHAINPNRFRSDIEKLILERTGQTVSLLGDIEITWWKPALQAKRVVMKDKNISAEILKIYFNPHTLFSDKKDLELELFDVQFKKFLIPEIYTTVQFEEGIIQLEAIHCELSHEKKTGIVEIDLVKIDTTGSTAKYFIQHDGDKFPIAFILALSGETRNLLEGADTYLKVELTAEGDDILPLKKTLSGVLEVEITHGKFYGTDLIKSLSKARSFFSTIASKMVSPLISSTDNSQTPHLHTPFTKLKLLAKIKNGIFHNHDLIISHKHYAVHGKGKINLHTQHINYQIEAFYKDRSKHATHIHSEKMLYSEPLRITVSGPLQKPDLKTDFDSYLKYVKKMKHKRAQPT